jgi:tripartite-type tricarboxylate transporter receptor subunit TctC
LASDDLASDDLASNAVSLVPHNYKKDAVMRIACVRILAAVLAIGSTHLSDARADSYPAAPVRIVVGFSAGGGTDLIGRIIAQSLATKMGGNFLVFNKPGAGAMIGAEMVATATADGYTLLLGTSAELTISPPLYGHAPYNPTKDFIPIAFLGTSPAVILANPDFEANDIRDVVTYAKKNPGKLVIATGGTGTAPDLAAYQLKPVAGIDFVITPYKGAGPSQADTVAGHVPIVFSTIASALPLINGKLLKPLAVVADDRSRLLPDVPSTAELGLKNYSAATWYGLFAPAGTPPDVVGKLRAAVASLLTDPAIQSKFITLGIEPSSDANSFAALPERIETELNHWTQIIKASGIKVE